MSDPNFNLQEMENPKLLHSLQANILMIGRSFKYECSYTNWREAEFLMQNFIFSCVILASSKVDNYWASN